MCVEETEAHYRHVPTFHLAPVPIGHHLCAWPDAHLHAVVTLESVFSPVPECFSLMLSSRCQSGG